jgi:two-component system, chemotaxis family, sensor kinase CheA
LFTLEDVSRLVALEAERAEGLAMIRALRNRHAFVQFARDAERRLSTLIASEADPATVRRDVHTIKGNASLFELKDVARCAGEVEECERITRAELKVLAASLRATLERFEHALGFSLLDEESTPAACDETTLRTFERNFARAADDAERSLLFQRLLKRLRMRTVRAMLGPVEDRVALLAERLEKRVECAVLGGEVLVSEQKVAPVLHALTHAIRNALDHGIEAPDEREGQAKKAEGRVELRFDARPDDSLHVIFSDDGRGIDSGTVAQRALEHGLLDAEALASLTPEQRLELVFLDGLSTASQATDVSGRGVGMSALRAAALAAGGQIRIHSWPGDGTTLEIVIPDATLRMQPTAPSLRGGLLG